MKCENPTSRRLHAAANHTSVLSTEGKEYSPARLARWRQGRRCSSQKTDDPNEVIVNGCVVILYTISESKNFALDVTSVGTRY